MIDELPLVVDAHHHRHGDWQKVFDGVLARARRFDAAMTILIGHSYGALRCEQIATKMQKNNLPVAYIAGIDPTALPRGHSPMTIPGNVEIIDEFHATRGIPANTRRRDPSGRKGGKYLVDTNRSKSHNLIEVPGPHISCASDKITQDRIVGKVVELPA